MCELDKASKTALAASEIWSHCETESETRMSDLPHRCFICNNRGISARNSVHIFDNQGVLLNSGKRLCEILSDLLGRCIEPAKNLHSDIICKKCYKNCEEYDQVISRAKEIQSSLMDDFKKTLTNYNNYELIHKCTNKDSKAEPGSSKMITGPSTKMSPMPKNVVILHNGKKLAIQKSVEQPVIPRIDLEMLKKKIPIIPLVKESITKKTSQQITINVEANNEQIDKDSQSTNKPQADTRSTGKQSSDTRSTEEQSSNVESTKKQGFDVQSTEKLGSDIARTKKQVIDDDISVYRIATDTSVEEHRDIKDENSQADKFIISEVEIMDGDFDLQDGAVVMEQDENGDFLRVLNNTGRFLKDKHGNMLYQDNDQISVLLPEDSEERTEDVTELEFSGQQFKIECNDSNDEQIELQMSGDEETANAILTAARQPGRTFIKLESNGVFRLHEVSHESETEAETQSGTRRKRAGNLDEIVRRDGSLYTCLLCLDDPLWKINSQGKVEKSSSSSDNSKIELGDAKEGNETSACESVANGCPFVGSAKNICEHVKNEHKIKIYVCELCGVVLRKLVQYVRHMENHDPETTSRRKNNLLGMRAHVCAVCKRKFSSKNILEEHMNIHNGIRPYKCSVCDKGFASKYTHQAHMKTHTDRPRPFACEICGKSFLTLQNLSQHEKTHSGIKEYICNVCGQFQAGKAFGTQHNLEVHGVVHSGHKPFSCKTCGKSFARHAEIRDHERTHTGERPFPCDICGASFSQRSNLQSHRRACHFDDKRHSCSQCDRKFKRRRLLEYHIKASHTGERPHKCDVCGASFVYPEHYKKHRRIHSGEKPYSCEVCGKPFNSRDNRNAHRFVHSDKKPYECMMCGMGFMRKPLLYTHMNSAGHLTDTIVVNQPQLSIENRDIQAVVRLAGVSSDSSLAERPENIDNELNSKDDELSESDVPDGARIMLSGDTTYILQNGDSHQMYTAIENCQNEESLVFNGEENQEISKHTIDLVEGSESADSRVPGLPDTIVSKGTELGNEDGASVQDEDMQQHIQIVTDENGHVLTTDENGTMIRLVQIQLPGGEHGWVALGP